MKYSTAIMVLLIIGSAVGASLLALSGEGKDDAQKWRDLCTEMKVRAETERRAPPGLAERFEGSVVQELDARCRQ